VVFYTFCGDTKITLTAMNRTIIKSLTSGSFVIYTKDSFGIEE
jgi:hypothetical protein